MVLSEREYRDAVREGEDVPSIRKLRKWELGRSIPVETWSREELTGQTPYVPMALLHEQAVAFGLCILPFVADAVALDEEWAVA